MHLMPLSHDLTTTVCMCVCVLCVCVFVCVHVCVIIQVMNIIKLTINIHTQFVDKVLHKVQISSANRELQYLP